MSELSFAHGVRRVLLAAVAVAGFLGLAAHGTGTAYAADGPCDLERLAQRLRDAGIEVQAVRPAAVGAAVILGPAGGSPKAVVVFGFTPAGELYTTQRIVKSAPPEERRWNEAVQSTTQALEGLAALRDCPGIGGGDPNHPETRKSLDRAFQETVAPPTSAPAASGRVLQRVVIVLSIISVFGYFFLILVWAIRRARQAPREVLVGFALFALALLVRVLSAPRQPMQSGNGDMSVLFDVARWLNEGVGGEVSLTYPPALRAFLWGVFKVFGPSCELAFWVVTLLGAATVVPVAGVVKRVTGSAPAGVLAGLALAAYPPAIFFSNGVNLETPAGLLIALSCVHALDVLQNRRLSDALLYVSALAVIIQSRAELLPAAPVLVAAHVLLAVERGALRGLVRLWPAALAGLALVTPFVVQVALASSDIGGREKSALLASVATYGALVVGLGALVLVAERRLVRTSTSARVIAVAVGVGALLVVGWAISEFSGNPFVSHRFLIPAAPYTTFYTDQVRQWAFANGTIGIGEPRPFFLELGIFPLAYLLLGLLSFLPAPEPPRLTSYAWLLVPLALFGFELTRWIFSGVVVAEGFRYHIPFYPFVAMAVGMGAYRALQWLGGTGRRLLLARGAAAVLILSPLATHAAFFGDTAHNAQREFAFAHAALAKLPHDSTILVPDDRLDLRGIGPGLLDVANMYRTEHLLSGLAQLRGQRLYVYGVEAALRHRVLLPGTVYFYQGIECYRALAPATFNPSCHVVRQLAGPRPPVAATRIPNRVYSTASPFIGLITPRLPMLDLALVPLTPADVDALRRHYGLAEPAPPAPPAGGAPAPARP